MSACPNCGRLKSFSESICPKCKSEGEAILGIIILLCFILPIYFVLLTLPGFIYKLSLNGGALADIIKVRLGNNFFDRDFWLVVVGWYLSFFGVTFIFTIIFRDENTVQFFLFTYLALSLYMIRKRNEKIADFIQKYFR